MFHEDSAVNMARPQASVYIYFFAFRQLNIDLCVLLAIKLMYKLANQ